VTVYGVAEEEMFDFVRNLTTHEKGGKRKLVNFPQHRKGVTAYLCRTEKVSPFCGKLGKHAERPAFVDLP
jgi:hypothetical protein